MNRQRIDLRDTTFIIPVRIDSRDREFNLDRVLRYMKDNFKTTVIVWEDSDREDARHIIGRIMNTSDFSLLMDYRIVKYNSKISFVSEKDGFTLKYIFTQNESPLFHRTRLLNQMLELIETPVVANYDCDVFMLPEVYKQAQDAVLAGTDLVYPYFEGESQIRVNPEDRAMLHDCNSLLGAAVQKQNDRLWGSRFGHVQFFNTKSYREGGMENEEFKSYGAEDSERFHRFKKLGYRVEYLNNYIFHLEHARGHNSSQSNPYFRHNEDLYRDLMCKDSEQTREYYKNAEYLRKYKCQD